MICNWCKEEVTFKEPHFCQGKKKESGLLQRGVMAHAFIEKCREKFERRAKERNRSLTPWKDFDIDHLCERLHDEFVELTDAVDESDHEAIMDECLDVANFAWMVYEQARMKKEGA